MRHTLKETLSGLRRNASMNVAILVTMWVSLTLFGLGVLVTQQVDLIKGRWYDKIELTAFLCTPDTQGGTCAPNQGTTDAERDAIRAALEANPQVQTVYYQSQAEVFEEFKVTYADSPIIGSLKAEDMQDLFRIKLKWISMLRPTSCSPPDPRDAPRVWKFPTVPWGRSSLHGCRW